MFSRCSDFADVELWPGVWMGFAVPSLPVVGRDYIGGEIDHRRGFIDCSAVVCRRLFRKYILRMDY